MSTQPALHLLEPRLGRLMPVRPLTGLLVFFHPATSGGVPLLFSLAQNFFLPSCALSPAHLLPSSLTGCDSVRVPSPGSTRTRSSQSISRVHRKPLVSVASRKIRERHQWINCPSRSGVDCRYAVQEKKALSARAFEPSPPRAALYLGP